MKTRVQAQHLQIGDIVGSGEKVINVVRKSVRLPFNKVAVTLKKDGHQRTVRWGKCTTISVERVTQNAKSLCPMYNATTELLDPANHPD